MTGVMFAAGVVHRAGPTIVAATGVPGSPGGVLDGSRIYHAVAPGVVDVTSRGVRSPAGTVAAATGTGFVVNAAGTIVTAAHVVDGASSITVSLQDGATKTAHVLGEDRATDLAVLAIDPAGLRLHPLALGSSRQLVVGDPLAAIGDPFHYERSLSTGVVSALDRSIGAPNGFSVAHAIQTDAALNPGNSGGPVLDATGRVVGVADQIATGGSGVDSNTGVGFAIPVDILKRALPQLEHGRPVAHAYLGVSTTAATAAGARSGALLQAVSPNGPAATAGLRAGDVITRLDGTAITGPSDLVAGIEAHKPGDQLQLTIRRGTHELSRSATLASQPARAPTG